MSTFSKNHQRLICIPCTSQSGPSAVTSRDWVHLGLDALRLETGRGFLEDLMPEPISGKYESHEQHPYIVVPSPLFDPIKSYQVQGVTNQMQANTHGADDYGIVPPGRRNQYWTHQQPYNTRFEYSYPSLSTLAADPPTEGGFYPTTCNYSYAYWNDSEDSLQGPPSRTGSISTESTNESTSTLSSMSAYSGSTELLQNACEHVVINPPSAESRFLAQEQSMYAAPPPPTQPHPVYPYLVHPSMEFHDCRGDASIIGHLPQLLTTSAVHQQPQYSNCSHHVAFGQPLPSFHHHSPIPRLRPPTPQQVNNGTGYIATTFSWSNPVEQRSQCWQPPPVTLPILHPIPRPISPRSPPAHTPSEEELASDHTAATLLPRLPALSSVQCSTNPSQSFLHPHHLDQAMSGAASNSPRRTVPKASSPTKEFRHDTPPTAPPPIVENNLRSISANSPMGTSASLEVDRPTSPRSSAHNYECMRRPWPTKFEQVFLTSEDNRLPASKRRRIYINSLEQQCNQLHETLKANGLSLAANSPPAIQKLRAKDTKSSIVRFQHEITLLRNRLTHLNTKSTKATVTHPHAKDHESPS